MRTGQRALWIGIAVLFTLASPAYAFPPQSVEFMPGYKTPDSASNGSFTGQLRYFLYFPSLYLSTGIGIGQVTAEANHINLAIGSDLEMTPLTFTVKLTPPHPKWFPFFLEVGIDRLTGLHYELDPAVNTGRNDSCSTDIATGPADCTLTTFKKPSSGYHIGAGVETVFDSGFGLGLHYMYLSLNPLERKIETTDSFGVEPSIVTREDIFKIKMSIFSLILSYHF